MLPFTPEQFLDVFAAYNRAVWPAQALAGLHGLAMVALLLRPSPAADRFIGVGLAVLWAWTGVVYHGLYFSRITPSALVFGALFVLQAAALCHAALLRGGLHFGASRTATGVLGWALVGYALVAYPLLGLWSGQRWPALPMFGITPCPLTIFTFGLLALTRGRVAWWLLAIPLGWSLIGGSAAWLLSVPEDWPLPLSGLAVLPLLRRRDLPPAGVAPAR